MGSGPEYTSSERRLELAAEASNRDWARYMLLRDAIQDYLDWHGYDNAEGLADALVSAEEL